MSEPVLPVDKLWDGCGSGTIASPVERSTDIDTNERRPIWAPDAPELAHLVPEELTRP